MSLQSNDLRKLVSKKIHIDEFRSKMGDDADVVVISFKVEYYDPASELTNFIEKGYEWVLDSDTSSGEMEDGSYLVFVETLRRPTVPEHLIRLVEDMKNLTDIDPSEYLFKYHKVDGYHPLTAEAIASIVPLSPTKYRILNGETDPAHDEHDDEDKQAIDPEAEDMSDELAADIKSDKPEEPTESKELQRALESLQTAAGIPIKAKPITDRELKEFVNLSKVSHVQRG